MSSNAPTPAPDSATPLARFLSPEQIAGGEKPLVSIVIPTRNGGRLFGEVLGALRRQRFAGAVELVVIDSGSTDDTVALAREHGARVDAIDPATFNHGLTRNLGIEKSAGDIIVLITQDATPADDHLIAAFARAYEDPAVGGAYARQIPRDEHDCLVRRNVANHLTGLPAAEVRRITDRAAYEALTPFERYRFCNFDNVCSSVRRAAWRQVPFRYAEFGEDLDWSKRALEAGWAIAYTPAAAVIHSHDRPVAYEYKRTYMCHRKLYELFGLHTIPRRRYILRNIIAATLGDTRYVLRHEPRLGRRLGMLAKIPALAVASVLGQYRGARDEARGRGRKLEGV